MLWVYLRRRWETNKWMLLDYLLLIPGLASRLISGGVSSLVRGKTGASDHAPVWITLKSKKPQGGGPRQERQARQPANR
jgi:exodeoxyribonuclease-3